uniref:Peptidase M12A domain-containing protein n=1 Tax=Timema cristinae TaxID=61476 RepID=A0A7R9DAC9_TIMCR|nr:unnamed protein product [Timema cristinae]
MWLLMLLELGTIWIFLSATLATSYLPISEFPNKLPISSLGYFNKVLVDPLVDRKSQQDLIILSKPVRGYSKESRPISTSSKFLMQHGASEVSSHVTGENLILELVERPSSRMKRSYLNRNYEDGPFFEGDIILPDHQHPDQKNIVKDPSLIWPNGQVPYQFDSGFTNDQKTTIENALTSLMKETCVRFVKRTNQANYVNVKNSGQG